ncbi:MAG: hypothetical protein WAP74_00050 [Patescibacteria group bacterium]
MLTGYSEPAVAAKNRYQETDRVSEISFLGHGVEAFRVVLSAFIRPFPSLNGLGEAVEEILSLAARPFAGTEEEAEQYAPVISKVHGIVEAASCDEQWPGHVYWDRRQIWSIAGCTVGNGPYGGTELVVAPYAGGRVLRVTAQWKGGVRRYAFQATADYSARPSVNAASDVRSLVWDDAMIRSRPDRWQASTCQTTHFQGIGSGETEAHLECGHVKFAL